MNFLMELLLFRIDATENFAIFIRHHLVRTAACALSNRSNTIRIRSLLLCFEITCFAAFHVYKRRKQRIHTHIFTHRLTDWLILLYFLLYILFWRWLQITWNASWPKVITLRHIVFVQRCKFSVHRRLIRSAYRLDFGLCYMHIACELCSRCVFVSFFLFRSNKTLSKRKCFVFNFNLSHSIALTSIFAVLRLVLSMK